MSRMTPGGTSIPNLAFPYPLTPPARYLVEQTYHIATERGMRPSSVHLLVSLLERNSPAWEVLREYDVKLPPITVEYSDMNALEPPEVLSEIWSTAAELASRGDARITVPHLLTGLLRFRTNSLAILVLQRHGVDPGRLRNRLLNRFTLHPNYEAMSISSEMTALTRAGALVEEQVAERVGQERGRAAGWPGQHAQEAPPSRGDGWLDPNHPLNAPNPYLPPGTTSGQLVPDWSQRQPAPPSAFAPHPLAPPVTGPSSSSLLRAQPMPGHVPSPSDSAMRVQPPAPGSGTHPPQRPYPELPRGAGQRFNAPLGYPPQPPRPSRSRRPRSSESRSRRPVPSPQRTTTPRRSSSRLTPTTPRHDARRSSKRKNLLERLQGRFGSRRPQSKPPQTQPASLDDLAESLFGDGSSIDDIIQGVEQPTADEAHPRRRRTRRDEEEPAAPESPQQAHGEQPEPEEEPAVAPEVSLLEVDKDAVTRISRAPLTPEQVQHLEEHYALDPEVYPFLAELGRNLSLEAVRGNIDDLVGREKEISQVIDTLNKRRNNNPLLVGPAGVGKTAIVEGLALSLINPEPNGAERIVVELEMGRLLSGTHLRGSFSERLIHIKDEVKKADGRVVVFLDELHTWMGAGGSGDGADAAGELKAALARGEFPCVGATTEEEYKRFIEVDGPFGRRFQLISVNEPTREEAIEVIRGILSKYSSHHDVAYDDDAVEAAVHLAQRYIPELRLPDKAINLIDLGGSCARRMGLERVDREVIANVVSSQTGVPVDKLLMRDRERFLRMEEIIGASLIGHQDVIRRLSEVIRRNYAGFHSGRPIGSFLFLGPTGVGKTELVKVLADFLFRDRNAFVRLDMSEFTESHTVSRMIGAPPGYVGYDQGGQLTEAVRKRPYQIILFDEIEKAHPEVLNILLQLLDDGRLTDGRNRTVDFSNTVVIMTSNLGAEHFAARLAEVTQPRIGFAPDVVQNGAYLSGAPALTPELMEAVLGAARKALTSELWNRINERLVFGPLSRYEVARIARLQFNDSARHIKVERHIEMVASDAVFEFLIDHGGYDPELGARPMRTTLQRLVETEIADMILRGEIVEGQRVRVAVAEGRLSFTISREGDAPA
ncbi:MAG: hypothetical protein CMH57_03985 [Myxococcales bacterium]|nr:hypothetical protein [Myxococcales bacterium]